MIIILITLLSISKSAVLPSLFNSIIHFRSRHDSSTPAILPQEATSECLYRIFQTVSCDNIDTTNQTRISMHIYNCYASAIGLINFSSIILYFLYTVGEPQIPCWNLDPIEKCIMKTTAEQSAAIFSWIPFLGLPFLNSLSYTA